MPITINFDPPPTPPSSTDKTNFRVRYDAFLAYIVTFVAKLISFVSQLNSTEANINTQANSAALAATAAAASANFQGVWSSSTIYSIGQSVAYNGIIYRSILAGSNNIPSSSPTYWVSMGMNDVIHAAPADTPTDDDEWGFWDGATSALKKISWGNLKANIYSYLQSLSTISFKSSVQSMGTIAAVPANYDIWQGFELYNSTGGVNGVTWGPSDGRILSMGVGPNGPFIRTEGLNLDLIHCAHILGVTEPQGDNSNKLATTAFVANTLANGSVKAWANFGWNGTAIVIYASANISGIVRNSAGYYTVTMTTAISDANYAVIGSAMGGANDGHGLGVTYNTTPTTTSFQIDTFIAGIGATDRAHMYFEVIR